MKSGTVVIRTKYVFRAYGLQKGFLWWEAADEKPGVLLEPRQPVAAFRCEKCGTVVVPPIPELGPNDVENPLAVTVYGDALPRPGEPRD